jgi:DNA (cytosine-5)-methyltransferase 1
MRVIDFFSGCGGSSLGMEQAGLNVILAIDLWEDACETHELNIDCPVWCEDINVIESSELPPCDVIIGSPPCQKFSQANYYDRNYDDALVKRFMQIVHEVNPDYWVWENVIGAKRAMPGVCLDAQNFGLPQRRKRHFVSNFVLPEKNNEPRRVVQDVIEPKGEGLLDGYNSKVYPLDGVCPTVRRIPLKWYDGRKMEKRFRFTGFEHLSIEDHLTLMGFPSDYELYGTKTSKMLQVGNAVCPPVMKAIGERILEYEEGFGAEEPTRHAVCA